MPKGNHVFNNFDNTVYNAFKALTEVMQHKDEQSRALDATGGSGGDKDKALNLLTCTYPQSYEIFRQTMAHERIAQLHRMQDDEDVQPNDPNSRTFGNLADKFTNTTVS